MWVGAGDSPIPQVPPLTSVTDPNRPGDARVLFANVGYRQQLGMLIFAHIYSRMNTDMTLSNKLRLWVKGQQGEVEIPEVQKQHFYDPQSGYTYVARRYGPETIDGKVVDRGIAARMLEHASALLASSYEVERDDDGNVVLDDYGSPILITDERGYAIPLEGDNSRIGELSKYVGLLDAARQIASLLGDGPL